MVSLPNQAMNSLIFSLLLLSVVGLQVHLDVFLLWAKIGSKAGLQIIKTYYAPIWLVVYPCPSRILQGHSEHMAGYRQFHFWVFMDPLKSLK